MPQLNYMASRMKAFGIMDPEDLVQAAVVGLMRTREKFDPARGIKWVSYAIHRARGAMLDALRNIDHVPRVERRRLKEQGLEARAVLSIDGQAVKVSQQGLPIQREALAERRDFWASLLNRVGRRVGEILRRYYLEDLTLKAIGRLMGLSESRVCQLHAKGIRQLRLLWEPSA